MKRDRKTERPRGSAVLTPALGIGAGIAVLTTVNGVHSAEEAMADSDAIAHWSPSSVTAQTDEALRSCVVIYDAATEVTTRTDQVACRIRLSPASTFKIPHALVALETGAVSANDTEQWDGTPYSWAPAWERDHTVVSAMRPSVVWFFQRLAPRVRAHRMRAWLERIEYGNADTSGPITEYWLNGRLRISPDEQVEFLRRFYREGLPFSDDHVRTVRDALEQAAGTVENASGVHSLEVAWRNGIGLNAKTGATQTEDGTGVSWLVGQLTIDDRRYVFASAVWRPDGSVGGLDATQLAMQTFIRRGLLAAKGASPS